MVTSLYQRGALIYLEINCREWENRCILGHKIILIADALKQRDIKPVKFALYLFFSLPGDMSI